MAFVVPKSLQETSESEVPKYSSGYTEEEELNIKQAKILIEQRDLESLPVTLEEFRLIIAPWFRINRTEEFILKAEKVKPVRVPREPKAPKAPKEPRVKKRTKAQVEFKMKELLFKLATNTEFTEEETLFYKEQTGES